MMAYLLRYGFDLCVKMWSVFYFAAGLPRKKGFSLQKGVALFFFAFFVMGQRFILNRQSLEEAFIRNLLLFSVTAGMMLAFYEGQRAYRVFIGGVIFFLWGGWLKLFTPFVFSTLHLPTFGYELSDVFPEWFSALAEGICRIVVMVLMKKFAFKISGDREISWREVFFSLLPALIDHTTILILYYLMIVAPSLPSMQIARELTLLILLLVFGMPCMLMATEQLFVVKKNKLELAFMETQMKVQLHEFEKQQMSDQQLRGLYHDFQNHLLVIQGMAGKGGTAVGHYIDELMKQSAQTAPQIECGHPVLNILLNQKAGLCREKGILFECMVDFTKVDFIRSPDLVALFTNAIDNAIEALVSVEEPERILAVSAGTIGNFVVSKFTNPYEAELCREGDRILTTKKDPRFHGLGISNIKRIVEAYHGICQIETENHVFELKWMVPFPDEG